MSNLVPFSTGVMTDGTPYLGNQQFKGIGTVRWCAICGTHKSQLGGTLQHVMGGRNWVCVKHKKVAK